jgi:sec-independent protein translocase protein TatB
MNFLGMGPMELLLIVILALMVFGPAKLPEIMGQVGKAIGDFRRATSDLSDEFNRTIQAELKETKSVVDEAKSVLTETRSAVTDVQATVNTAVTSVSTVPAPTRVAAPDETIGTPNGTGDLHAEANGTAPAESKPPLADTAQWSWETSPATPADTDTPTTASSADTVAAPAAETATAAAESPDTVAADQPSDGVQGVSAPLTSDVGASERSEADETTTAQTPPAQERTARDDLQPPY